MNPRRIQNWFSRSQRKLTPLTLLVVIFVSILIGCKPTGASATRSSPTPPSTVPTLTEVAIRQMLGTKESDLAHIEQTETAFRQLPLPSPGHVFQSPLLLPTQPVPTAFAPIPAGSDTTLAGAGTIVVRLTDLAMSQYRIGNEWIEDTHNARTRLMVLAGVVNGPDHLPSAQGIVIVETWQRSVISNTAVDTRVGIEYYLTPSQNGPLKITDAVGERLVIQSITNGTKFYFDVPSRQFVSSMAVIVPTVTIPISPLVTPTPAL